MSNPYFFLIRTVWQYSVPWHRSIVACYLAYIVAQGCLSLTPYAFGRTLDLLQHFHPDQFWNVMYWLALGLILIPLFWLFHGPARVIERRVALSIQQAFRLNLYEKLTRLPLKWHQDHHSGNMITCINRASTALQTFAEEQVIYVETIVKFIISIAFLMCISWPVGLITLVSCGLSILIVLLFDRQLIPLYQSENDIDNRVGGLFYDYISNMTTILTLRLADRVQGNLSHHMMSVWRFFNKETTLNEAKWFAMGLALSALQSGILIGYIIYTLKKLDAVLIGNVVMIFQYQRDLSGVFTP